MRPHLLANENFPMPAVTRCVTRVMTSWPSRETHRGITDREVLSLDVGENRWVATFDRDYP